MEVGKLCPTAQMLLCMHSHMSTSAHDAHICFEKFQNVKENRSGRILRLGVECDTEILIISSPTGNKQPSTPDSEDASITLKICITQILVFCLICMLLINSAYNM